MNIESQTTSIEHSKRLKELGINQESLYYWEKCPDKKNEFTISCNEHHDQITDEWTDCHLLENQENYSAFIASELMQLLPNRITLKENEPFNSFRLNIMKSVYFPDPHNLEDKHDLYIVNYECDSTACTGEDAWLRRQLTKNIYCEKFTDSLAEMLIYLIENGLMEIK